MAKCIWFPGPYSCSWEMKYYKIDSFFLAKMLTKNSNNKIKAIATSWYLFKSYQHVYLMIVIHVSTSVQWTIKTMLSMLKQIHWIFVQIIFFFTSNLHRIINAYSTHAINNNLDRWLRRPWLVRPTRFRIYVFVFWGELTHVIPQSSRYTMYFSFDIFCNPPNQKDCILRFTVNQNYRGQINRSLWEKLKNRHLHTLIYP